MTTPSQDNERHANGTCEACDGPCTVFGCRYSPDCYRPASLARRRTSNHKSGADQVAALLHLGEPFAAARDYHD